MGFQDKDGNIFEFLGCTICPIVESIEEGRSQLCGTGFFINPQGLALSASHNFRKRTAEIFSNGKKVDQVDAVTFIRIFYNPENTVDLIFNPIQKVIYREGFDIAVVHSAVGDKKPPKWLGLTYAIPRIGEKIYTYSYPNETGFTDNIRSKMALNRAEFEGVVTAHFPCGRDRILMPGPCIEAKMSAPGGTSGGPVFNSKGHVFGVISTSFDVDPPIAYITPIRSILDLSFEINFDTGLKTTTLRELGRLKLIALYEE